MPCTSYADDHIENLTESRSGVILVSTSEFDKTESDILAHVPEPKTAYEDSTSESEPALKISPEDNYNIHGQATYIFQKKPGFDAPYDGPQSLTHSPEKGYSTTFTGFLGARLWKGSELYWNPEAIQAVPLSNLHGLSGLTNSEQQKTSGPNPIFYNARLYLRQIVGFGGGREAVEDGPNQLAGMVDKRRLTVTVGTLSITDIFENAKYAHDPRTQFLNWSFFTYGAFDYAADARGYTSGGAAELYYDDWALRVGRFMVPKVSNGLQLDPQIMKYHGDQIEVEHSHTFRDQPGKIRILAFRNQAVMGRFDDAIAFAVAHGGVPDVGNVRKNTTKVGFGVSFEQAVSNDIGIFVRGSWADGETETYSFAEIENSLTGGMLAKGNSWGRERDTVGLAFAQNGLGSSHRAYLAAGGLGAFIGDGQLPHYEPERIVEAFYDINLIKSTSFMVDMQRIENPAYNADRGPVNVFSVRLHAEF